MDPFNKLPPEIRVKILGSIPSHATTARLIRASPIMLAQYTTTESTNLLEYLSILVGNDINDHELLQDALAVIHFSQDCDKDSVCDLVRNWKTKSLPSPFPRSDYAIITNLRLLFERTSEFIDDYLSKATAQNTVEAYLQPPRRTYIDTVDPQPITLHDLSPQERLRLFQAFIKFELLCKICSQRVQGALATTSMKGAPKSNSWEKEALACVYEYMKASYTAIFAQCAGVPTFKRYKNTCDRLRRFRLDRPFFLETMLFDPHYPFLCYPFPKYSAIYLEELPWCGFDVLSHLMTEAKKAKCTPAWILDMCSRYKRRGNDRVQPFLDRALANMPSGQETGLWAYLPTGHSNGTDTEANQITRTQRTIYQQRAWVFFDDARLCPGREAHFPTAEEMKTEIEKLENERMMETREQWKEYFDKKRPNPPRYKSAAKCVRYDEDMEMKEDREIYLGHLAAPPFFALH
ncbi:uncharacterized protein BKA55DRAFT_591948 [Fusarium redolens]|uniref:Uncharacterized protein n=1 Tax=Fusarium redolens TaxID=48865 RepID=A0A9P9KF48_FUSRE|nr:uncharacterized protein BKA55DRAFT_591948 [Fusarium redolens]KAH7259168.1 hypothetical protein BKA55DRAFT_591948 [Fusarium redolens]